MLDIDESLCFVPAMDEEQTSSSFDGPKDHWPKWNESSAREKISLFPADLIEIEIEIEEREDDEEHSAIDKQSRSIDSNADVSIFSFVDKY